MANVSAWQQDEYAELCLRAKARQYWPDLGFFDPAAQLMLERLGFGGGKDNNHGQNERLSLKRSRWFDRRCELFFARYPEAMCIELGAGLSTRFHRLSSQADWPRFHWLEVDAPEIIQQKNHLLPSIDNYQLMASELISMDWLMAWQGEPLILLAEHQLMYMNRADVETLFNNIARRARQLMVCNKEPIAIEIAFDYLSPLNLYVKKLLTLGRAQTADELSWALSSAKYLSNMDKGYSVLLEDCLNEYTKLWKRCIYHFYRWTTGGKHLEACAGVTWACFDQAR